jgi:hypothetical protein
LAGLSGWRIESARERTQFNPNAVAGALETKDKFPHP